MTPAAQQPPLILTAHNNQSLFSDHYLSDILRTTDAWRAAIPEAQAFLEWLRDLYATEQAQLAAYNESQLEDNWFRPIFDRLGQIYEGQPSVPGLKSSTKRPDYAFFPSETARKEAVSLQNSADYATHALAVGEVKQWGINLSKKTGQQPIFDNQNPMYQIDTYLNLTGLSWGMVSNGRFWRLVHKDSSRTLETYFEIDLLALLEPDRDGKNRDVAAATFFWLFFRQGAFRPDSHGRLFLDDALSQSRAYALALEADLRDNAYRALEQLIIGFFAGDGALDPKDEADRDRVYRSSLYLLYRLLFLFYGESRALLPMHNPRYQDGYSLQTLAQRINSGRSDMDSLPTTGKAYWHRLAELCRLISGVDAQLNADLGVPRYNGGLFDPAQHPFLEQRFVGDRYLAHAIDYLAYRRVRQEGKFQGFQAVDYRTLDVRQLGSVYEGLLEYRVAVATEEMVTVRKKGVEQWRPARGKGKAKVLDRRQIGELYLATDKGERKATGSYYTPDYIVEYIVANTLGPLVAGARARVKDQVRQTGSLDEEERRRQSAALFVEEILRLNVLDPAMGSGHFLVEAMNFLARALATDEYVQAPGGADAQVPGTSEVIRSEQGTGKVPGTSGDSDLLYWKRRVVEACIYGVDKNPMAVELAKLSLWLKTAAADKPLSFLDHHLRHGDSLIGAWLADLQAAPGSKVEGQRSGGAEEQKSLFDEGAFTQDIFRVVDGVMTIERASTDSIDDVHMKEAVWAELQETHIKRWRRLADLWVSYYFGNAYTPQEYRALAARLQGGDSLMPAAQAEGFLGHDAVADNDYFHWELAFPEVFFDEYGRGRGDAAGFDAVIGNPPYVRQEGMGDLKNFFSSAFEAVFDGKADLYVYFYQISIELLRIAGLTSFIVTNKWLRSGYGRGVRGFLAQNSTVREVVDFGHAPIFPGVDVFPVITLFEKAQPNQTKQNKSAKICLFPREQLGQVSVNDYIRNKSYEVPETRFNSKPWSLEPREVENLIQKIWGTTIPLNEFCGCKPIYGVKTGYNKAFLIDEKTKDEIVESDQVSAEILKPYLRGQDINRWQPEWENLWMIFTHSGLDIDDYQGVKRHLDKYRKRLEARSGSQEWWELQGAPSTYHLFEKPKLIYQEIQFHPAYCYDEDGYFPNNKGFILPTADLYLLAVLNSPLIWWFNWRYLPHMKDEALNPKGDLMEKLPIAKPTEKIHVAVESYAQQIIALTRKYKSKTDDVINWLNMEFGVEKPGTKLESFETIDTKTFVAEVKKRSAKSAKKFSPTEVKLLKDTHELYRREVKIINADVRKIEQSLDQLVCQAYGLSEKEIQWLWDTAPPRMPISNPKPARE